MIYSVHFRVSIREFAMLRNPNRSPYSQRTHKTRPDGSMVLNESSVEGGRRNAHYWEDLPVTMEFKKDK